MMGTAHTEYQNYETAPYLKCTFFFRNMECVLENRRVRTPGAGARNTFLFFSNVAGGVSTTGSPPATWYVAENPTSYACASGTTITHHGQTNSNR